MFLLALVPAYMAGMLALVAFSRTAPGTASAAVLIAFAATLVSVIVWARVGTNPNCDSHDEAVRQGSRKLTALLLLAAIGVSVLVTYPQVGELGRLILGNTGDSGLNIYLLEWQLHAAADDLGSYFDPTIFAPERFTLFWGPSLIPVAPVYGVAKALLGSPIPSFNVLMVLATLATLTSAYVFLRKLGFAQLVSGLGAVLYATTAQRLAHLSHLDSFQTLWLPIFGTLIVRVWERDRVRDGVLLGVALGMALSSAPYYFLSGLALVAFMVGLTVTRWENVPRKGVAAATCACLLLAGPILMMSKLAGLTRARSEVFPMSWADFYHPGAYIPALRWLERAAANVGGGHSLENWLFPSVVLAVLGTLGSFRWLGARRQRQCPLPPGHPSAAPRLLGAAAASSLVLAVGPYLEIAGRHLPLPMAVLMRLPGFESARVTGRFIAPAFLALTVVALVGLEGLTARLREPAKAAALVVLVTLALTTAQAFQPKVPLDVSGEPARVNRELASRRAGLVVELPWSGCPGYGCLYTEPPRMIWSRFDWFPRLGGYSGYIPRYWSEAHQAFAEFPDLRSFEFLRRYGARYVVLRVNAGVEGAHFAPADAASIAARASGFTMVREVVQTGRDYLIVLR